MKHFGDITKLSGYELPLVDVCVGGSPCQDLSVAGKRAGLAGERSGLFMEQIRLIKEMRDESRQRLCGRGADVDLRLLQPRFMVWENVPGAFSSNGGEDFRAVLEETARVVCEDAIIPRPSGRWSASGAIMGDGWSIAWRVHDAQFWGVPQRRKRIALVADFGGESAPEILFERKSVSRDSAESADKGQGTPEDSEGNPRETISFQERAGCEGGAREYSSRENEQEHSQPLTTNPSSSKAYGMSSYASNAMLSPNPHSGIYEADTARTLDNNGGNPACNQGGMIVLEGNGARESHKGPGYAESETMFTLNTVEQHSVCYQETTGPLCPGAHAGSYNGQDAYNDMLVVENGGGVDPVTASKASFFLNARSDGTADTLVATDYKDPQLVCYGLDRASFNQGQNALYDFSVEQELAQPLIARGPGGVLTEQ